jgi:hypothetical protein
MGCRGSAVQIRPPRQSTTKLILVVFFFRNYDNTGIRISPNILGTENFSIRNHLSHIRVELLLRVLSVFIDVVQRRFTLRNP